MNIYQKALVFILALNFALPIVLFLVGVLVGHWTRGRKTPSWATRVQKFKFNVTGEEAFLSFLFFDVCALLTIGMILVACLGHNPTLTILVLVVVVALVFVPRVIVDINHVLQMTREGNSSRLDDIEKKLGE